MEPFDDLLGGAIGALVIFRSKFSFFSSASSSAEAGSVFLVGSESFGALRKGSDAWSDVRNASAPCGRSALDLAALARHGSPASRRMSASMTR